LSGLPDYREALHHALAAVDERDIERLGMEEVALADASGRILAQPVRADRDLPPFNRAMMDGYALRAAEVACDRGFPLAGEVPAGSSGLVSVPAGSCVKIATGAALPLDCDAVIQHELSDRGDPVRFTIDRIEPGHAVHPRAADARAGDELMSPRTVIGAQHLGIAAAVGATTLRVRGRPRAAVLTSGDEVMAVETAAADLEAHHIRNSNGLMIGELLRRFGTAEPRLRHVRDEFGATLDAVRSAIGENDIVITVGGVSAGERDHFPAAFDACGVTLSLVGAAIQPGRPIVVGRTDDGVIVIALPGNPVSALACACLFAWPIVRRLLGLTAALPWREIELAEAVKPNAHRRAFRPAIVREDGRAVVPSWAGSGDLAHTSPTHGLIELPVQSDAVAIGTRLRFLAWP
jgi:molybdopterin molybdotransferase